MSDSRLLNKVADWLHEYGLELLTATLPIIIGITGGTWIAADEPSVRLSITNLALLPLYLVVVMLRTKQARNRAHVEKRCRQLEEQVEAMGQGVRALVFGTLLHLSEQEELDFGSRGADAHERITIYRHDPGGYFVPFGRYSKNPAFRGIGRPHYPARQGFIWKAWTEKCFFNCSFPDPNADPDKYIARHAHFNLPKGVARKLSMKSRLYFGWQIVDPSGLNELAVVILESTDPNRYTEEGLRAFFGKNERALSQLVGSIAPTLPEATSTRKAGF